MKRRIHIETYGCQMNDYESDRTYRTLEDRHGYERTDDPTQADVVLFNTCSIREKADQKAMSSIGKLRTYKTARPEVVIGVGGCMAQLQGEEIMRRAPHVDLVFGTHQWAELPALIDRARERRIRAMEVEMYGWKNYSFLPYQASIRTHPVCELVTVQNGCNKFCSFCLVPFTRGREVSRPVSEILDEIRSLAEQGVREVTLLGQNVNAYGTDRAGEISFAELLRKVAEVDGLRRIRFMTSHPAELSLRLIDELAENEKVAPHLHLPLQSGSDRVLERMLRGYKISEYREKVVRLRKRTPGISLTTDFIVGFPGETDQDFRETLKALREFEFDDSYSFAYSARPNTKAAKWTEDLVSSELAAERLTELQSLQDELRNRSLQRYIGKTVEVLVEGASKKSAEQMSGRTGTNLVVNFQSQKEAIGEIKTVKILDARTHVLLGATDAH